MLVGVVSILLIDEDLLQLIKVIVSYGRSVLQCLFVRQLWNLDIQTKMLAKMYCIKPRRCNFTWSISCIHNNMLWLFILTILLCTYNAIDYTYNFTSKRIENAVNSQSQVSYNGFHNCLIPLVRKIRQPFARRYCFISGN